MYTYMPGAAGGLHDMRHTYEYATNRHLGLSQSTCDSYIIICPHSPLVTSLARVPAYCLQPSSTKEHNGGSSFIAYRLTLFGLLLTIPTTRPPLESILN